jgi:hypothetical protein
MSLLETSPTRLQNFADERAPYNGSEVRFRQFKDAAQDPLGEQARACAHDLAEEFKKVVAKSDVTSRFFATFVQEIPLHKLMEQDWLAELGLSDHEPEIVVDDPSGPEIILLTSDVTLFRQPHLNSAGNIFEVGYEGVKPGAALTLVPDFGLRKLV